MQKIYTHDLMVVYSELQARSAASRSSTVTKPFAVGEVEFYNQVYAYFLKTCQKQGLKAAFTSSADIVGPGEAKCYWQFKNGQWIKVKKTAKSHLIFDKFSSANKTLLKHRHLLFSSPTIKAFNHPTLHGLFFDKLKTYQKFSSIAIPSVVVVDSKLSSIEEAKKRLAKLTKRHQFKDDFSSELILLKDRNGSEGNNIFRFKISAVKEIQESMKKNQTVKFILQPFLNFDNGFQFEGQACSADIRLIFLGSKFVQSYLRIAQNGDYRCNEHQGGRLKYVKKVELPKIVIQEAETIAKTLAKFNSIFSLDFIISNHGHVFLLEGNTGPGLDWNPLIKENEIEAKKLIRIIVQELKRRVKKDDSSKNSLKKINLHLLPVTTNHLFSPRFQNKDKTITAY